MERRFDAAVAAYGAALAAGTAGVGFGVAMAVGTPSPQLRAAHLTLNLLGLVGLVVGGTLPSFAATVGRSRMGPTATGPRPAVAVGWQATALAVATVGLGVDADIPATAGLTAYALGILGILWLVPRPTRRQRPVAGRRPRGSVSPASRNPPAQLTVVAVRVVQPRSARHGRRAQPRTGRLLAEPATEIAAVGSESARYDVHVHTVQRRGSVQPDDLATSLGDYVVIDVRDRSQFDRGHIPGSVHVPIERLRAGWVPPDMRVPVAVLGEGDADAEAAAVLVTERGPDAITISGGAQAWRAAGRCFVTSHH